VTASPLHLFPWLAGLFLLATVYEILRRDGRKARVRTWLLLALSFGAVSVWLRWT
jgi:hypothetical protein